MRKYLRPSISVIMNCRNGQNYLDQSIKSIIDQTYNNWELIFFDNRSIDNSKKILKFYKDKRIRYFKSKKVLNLYDARNQAIKKAKGKYITFLDTDDIWLKNKLKKQIKFFHRDRSLRILHSNFYHFYQSSEKKVLRYKKKFKSGYITDQLLKSYSIGILTVMLRKDVFKFLRFKSNYNIIGDFDFFINLSRKFKIFYIHEPLAIYRDHQQNFSKKNIKIFIKELKYWLIKNKKKFESFDLSQIKKNILKLRIKYFLSFLGV